jgi:hypothetical protein
MASYLKTIFQPISVIAAPMLIGGCAATMNYKSKPLAEQWFEANDVIQAVNLTSANDVRINDKTR